MLIIGQQSAYTGARTGIESVKWSVRNWRSGAVREGKIPNGFETSVKPPLQVVFLKKIEGCQSSEDLTLGGGEGGGGRRGHGD